jgi:hypothetical protein
LKEICVLNSKKGVDPSTQNNYDKIKVKKDENNSGREVEDGSKYDHELKPNISKIHILQNNHFRVYYLKTSKNI